MIHKCVETFEFIISTKGGQHIFQKHDLLCTNDQTIMWCMYYVCITCMYYMHVLYVCIICVCHMYVSYLCITCIYYMSINILGPLALPPTPVAEFRPSPDQLPPPPRIPRPTSPGEEIQAEIYLKLKYFLGVLGQYKY